MIKVAILVDVQNMFYSARNLHNAKVDYKDETYRKFTIWARYNSGNEGTEKSHDGDDFSKHDFHALV